MGPEMMADFTILVAAAIFLQALARQPDTKQGPGDREDDGDD